MVRVLIGLVLSAAMGVMAPASAAERLVVGVSPQQSAGHLAEQWVPLLEEVGKRLGFVLTFRTAANEGQFESRVLAGEYDVVYASPVVYLAAAKKLGAQAVARQRQDEQGVLVVRTDSLLHGPADLRDRAVAFPAASAYGASVLTQAELYRQGVVIYARYQVSDASVIRAVEEGWVDAGGVSARALANLPAETRSQLRVILSTRHFPAYPLFVLPRLGAARIAHLQAVLLSLDDDEAGRAVLARASFLGVALTDDQTYDSVRQIAAPAVARLLSGAQP